MRTRQARVERLSRNSDLDRHDALTPDECFAKAVEIVEAKRKKT